MAARKKKPTPVDTVALKKRISQDSTRAANADANSLLDEKLRRTSTDRQTRQQFAQSADDEQRKATFARRSMAARKDTLAKARKRKP